MTEIEPTQADLLNPDSDYWKPRGCGPLFAARLVLERHERLLASPDVMQEQMDAGRRAVAYALCVALEWVE